MRNSVRPDIPNLAIDAAAGAGKTFQLSQRFAVLMAAGIPPDRIAALTFSRKAAGEIFDAVADQLIRAARSEEGASGLSAEAGVPVSQADAQTLLRRFLLHQHRLQVGTLDGFLVQVLRCFAPELGLPAIRQILDEDAREAKRGRRTILRDAMAGLETDEEAGRAFFEEVKQSLVKGEDRRFVSSLDTTVETYHQIYRRVPDQTRWGQADTVWPDTPAWERRLPPPDEPAAIVEAWAVSPDAPGRLADKLREFSAECCGYHGATRPPDKFLTFMEKQIIPHLPALRRGEGAITFSRQSAELPPEVSRAVADLADHVLKKEMDLRLGATQSTYRLIRRYDEAYRRGILRSGVLTFDDILELVDPAGATPAPMLSQERIEEARLYLNYRLDGRVDHWLLDEFQDTSDRQWRVLEPLIDEVVQDPEDRRLFLVGDVKQAIYRWRGGNAALFARVRQRYEAVLQRKHLTTSFRSAPEITAFVNEVFESPQAAGIEAVDEAVCARWAEVFKQHRSHDRIAPPRGQVAVLQLGEKEERTQDGLTARRRVICDLLRRIKPAERGWTVAVLVKTNAEVKATAEALRRREPGLEVYQEGKNRILDTCPAALLVSLFRLAIHPGDTLSRGHIEMSPLAQEVGAAPQAWRSLPLRVQREVADHGFAGCIAIWRRALEASAHLTEYERHRLDDVETAALHYDAGGDRDPAGFIRFLEDYRQEEKGRPGSVRVMTVHQSKGLGFDVVVLPGLDGLSFRPREDDPLVHTDGIGGPPLWVLNRPRRHFCDADPILSGARRQDLEAGAFETLCLLYVAMTRAKRGLYIIANKPGKTSTPTHAEDYLSMQLRGDIQVDAAATADIPWSDEDVRLVHEGGDWQWVEDVPAPKSDAWRVDTIWEGLPVSEEPARAERLNRRTPSRQAAEPEPAAQRFQPVQQSSTALGTAVHSLLEQIEWADGGWEDVVGPWRAAWGGDPEDAEAAVEHVRRMMSVPEARNALSRPDGDRVEVWREAPFEGIVGADWVSGTFDRVVLERDEEGRPARAEILDYKTNELSGANPLERMIRHYTPQMALYRTMLGRLLNLEEDAIRCRLLLTRTGRVLDIAE